MPHAIAVLSVLALVSRWDRMRAFFALTRARLEEIGWTPGDGPVVQGAAGSSRADGRADMSRAAGCWLTS